MDLSIFALIFIIYVCVCVCVCVCLCVCISLSSLILKAYELSWVI